MSSFMTGYMIHLLVLFILVTEFLVLDAKLQILQNVRPYTAITYESSIEDHVMRFTWVENWHMDKPHPANNKCRLTLGTYHIHVPV